MKITPVGDRIHIQLAEVKKIGGLDVGSKKSANEAGTVIAVGPDVKGVYKKGDRLFVKVWAVDIITHNDETHYFVSESTNGICAIVAEK